MAALRQLLSVGLVDHADFFLSLFLRLRQGATADSKFSTLREVDVLQNSKKIASPSAVSNFRLRFAKFLPILAVKPNMI